MTLLHTIRLRDPWEATALPDGSTRFRRRFGQPRLGEGETVWLVCPGAAHVQLNDESEVTSRLLPRNELVIVSMELGEVRLEIRN
jgi:hypothetical protein